MSADIAYDSADPSDVDFYEFDFYDTDQPKGPCLIAGDTILTATVTAAVLLPPASGATPAALTVTGAVIGGPSTAPSTRVTTQASGGTADTDYLLTCVITTAAGRTLSRSVRLPVRDI